MRLILALLFLPLAAVANPCDNYALLAPGAAGKAATEAEREAVIRARFENGAEDYSVADKFANEILRLGPAAVAQWRGTIARIHREVEKNFSIRPSKRMIPGRRLLDKALVHLSRPDKAIAKKISAGASPTQAFKSYLDEEIAFFGGNYQAEDILLAATGIQKYLRSYKRHLIEGGPPPSVVIGGSVVNGKGRIGASDLDLAFFTDSNMTNYTSEVQEALDAALAKAGRNIELPLDAHYQTEHFYGLNNGLTIRITADRVDLLVYQPSRSAGQDQRKLTVPPREYELDLSQFQ